MTSQVAPAPIAEALWIYELHPAYPLPEVDLSVSVRSRFLSPRWIDATNRWLKYRRVIIASFVLSTIASPTVLLLPTSRAQVISVVFCPLVMIAPLAGLLLVRHNVVVLLMQTYDFWFFFAMSSITFLVLAVELGGLRSVFVFALWICTFPNLMADAVIRAVRRFATVNFIGTIGFGAMFMVHLLDQVREPQPFVVVRYGSHEVPSGAVYSSGMMTVLALFIRSVYRKRETFQKRANPMCIQCVSYRSSLRLCAIPHVPYLEFIVPAAPTHVHIQKLRCILPLQQVDARRAVSPPLVVVIAISNRFSRSFFRAMLLTTGVLSVVAALNENYWQNPARLGDPSEENQHKTPFLRITAAVMTLVYCMASILLCQRQLLVALLTSFDCIYLSVQLIIVHLSLCDFLGWSSDCCFVCISWLWVHWVICLDALPPVLANLLGVPSHLRPVIFTLFMTAIFFVIYLLVFSDAPPSSHDRVLWQAVVLGQTVEFRLVPVFFNSLASILPWCMRLWSRLWMCERDVLVVLDAAVEYDNYLRKTKEQVRSRRWDEAKTINTSR